MKKVKVAILWYLEPTLMVALALWGALKALMVNQGVEVDWYYRPMHDDGLEDEFWKMVKGWWKQIAATMQCLNPGLQRLPLLMNVLC